MLAPAPKPESNLSPKAGDGDGDSKGHQGQNAECCRPAAFTMDCQGPSLSGQLVASCVGGQEVVVML